MIAQNSASSNRNVYVLLYVLLAIAYIGGLFLQILEVDAAQYAAMSMEMLKSKSFLQIFDGGAPYLDKPPLLMWLSSLSFYLFGISEFAYRLPSFLASIFAVYCTYRLAKQWYSPIIANWSALVLASSQAFFLFNQDVKTDNLLTCWVIFSIWQLSSFITDKKTIGLILGFLGIGLAMLAKGPIGLIVPAAAIGSHLLLQRNWKAIFDAKWLLGIPLVLIVLSPMLYGLYEQWGWAGIKFYFWTQSFGRITGASTWNNDSGYFFFVSTFLWAFLPWTLCAIAGVFMSLKEIVKSRFKLNIGQEGMTVSGLILVFIALSLSHYKLPHYIFVLFPFCAIITARWLHGFNSITNKWLSVIQLIVYILMGIAICILLSMVFKPVIIMVLTAVAILLVTTILVAIKGTNAFQKTIIPGIMCMAAVNIGLNWDFYPELLQYQCSNAVGKIINGDDSQLHKAIPEDKFYFFNGAGFHSLNFYAQRIVKPVYGKDIEDTLAKRDVWIYVDQDDYHELAKYQRLENENDRSFEKYPVQNISLPFLNPATRLATLHKMWLVHLAKTAPKPNLIK